MISSPVISYSSHDGDHVIITRVKCDVKPGSYEISYDITYTRHTTGTPSQRATCDNPSTHADIHPKPARGARHCCVFQEKLPRRMGYMSLELKLPARCVPNPTRSLAAFDDQPPRTNPPRSKSGHHVLKFQVLGGFSSNRRRSACRRHSVHLSHAFALVRLRQCAMQ